MAAAKEPKFKQILMIAGIYKYMSVINEPVYSRIKNGNGADFAKRGGR
jgi:hypothetical protein